MTLESEVTELTATVNRLVQQVRTSLEGYKAEIAEVRRAVGVEFYVSRTITPSSRADTSIAAIQAKIEAFRQNTQTNAPVSILVESFTDSYPVRITSSRLEFRFQFSSRMTPPTGVEALAIDGNEIVFRNVMIEYRTREDSNTAIIFYRPNTGTETQWIEVRSSTLVNVATSTPNADRVYFSELIER